MNNIKNLKFVTEDDKEYVVILEKVINDEQYGYAVNLNDEADAMFVKIAEDEEGYFFDVVTDKEIMKEIFNIEDK